MVNQSDKHIDLYRRWTNAAINCYKIGCNCNICELKSFCERQLKANEYRIYPMKYSVLRLYARHGKPQKGVNTEV